MGDAVLWERIWGYATDYRAGTATVNAAIIAWGLGIYEPGGEPVVAEDGSYAEPGRPDVLAVQASIARHQDEWNSHPMLTDGFGRLVTDAPLAGQVGWTPGDHRRPRRSNGNGNGRRGANGQKR